jgi:hypothetical protein
MEPGQDNMIIEYTNKPELIDELPMNFTTYYYFNKNRERYKYPYQKIVSPVNLYAQRGNQPQYIVVFFYLTYKN